jgi:hypothetical protein
VKFKREQKTVEGRLTIFLEEANLLDDWEENIKTDLKIKVFGCEYFTEVARTVDVHLYLNH